MAFQISNLRGLISFDNPLPHATGVSNIFLLKHIYTNNHPVYCTPTYFVSSYGQFRNTCALSYNIWTLVSDISLQFCIICKDIDTGGLNIKVLLMLTFFILFQYLKISEVQAFILYIYVYLYIYIL